MQLLNKEILYSHINDTNDTNDNHESTRTLLIVFGSCSEFIYFFLFLFSFTRRESISSKFLDFLYIRNVITIIAMKNFPHLSLLITLFALVLTSSVKMKPDGTSTLPPIPGSDSLSKVDNVSSDKKALKLWNTDGPITTIYLQLTTEIYANIKNTVNKLNKSDELRTRENVLKEKNDNLTSKKEKIKPRKGVDANMDPQMTNTSFNQILDNTEPMISSYINNFTNFIDQSMNSNTSLIPTSTVIFHEYLENHTTISKTFLHIEKHVPKPKPTVTTIDGSELNESRLSQRTKNPPLGIPRKIDYIFPIIITIIALPILGTGIFVLYRRGRDCWDKRHYRRMDFLIDGMYND